ncbi:TPA: SEC-C domain-containing protein [Streptococcus suis]
MSNNRNIKCACGSGKKYKQCCLKLIPKSSCDYLNNNFEIINLYRELYRDEIDISKLINQLTSGLFSKLLLRDLFRFRVFVDSTMLLFNREKLEREFFQNKFVYNQFFENLNKDLQMQAYLTCYRGVLSKNLGYSISKFDRFYVSFDESVVRPYNQLARVRNAFAHMNYGHFSFIQHEKYGLEYLVGFYIYNRDNKTNLSKHHGFIFEPVLHRFIQTYFSNYSSYGIVYKHTWFSIVHNREELLTYDTDCKLNTLTYNSDVKYGGESSHDMISFTKKFQTLSHDELLGYISENPEKYYHTVENISRGDFNRLLDFVKKELARNILPDEFFKNIKFLYDFETEFSNFLVHLMQLNDRLIDYHAPFISKDSENISKILSSIEELKEDEDSWIAFKYMFPILNVVNICLRFEDDDLFKIDPTSVDTKDFIVDSDAVQKYIERNPHIAENHINNFYVVEKLRNSIAHGHIELKLSDNLDIIYVFTDIWNKREEDISISYLNLIHFIDQNIFKFRK